MYTGMAEYLDVPVLLLTVGIIVDDHFKPYSDAVLLLSVSNDIRIVQDQTVMSVFLVFFNYRLSIASLSFIIITVLYGINIYPQLL